MSFDLEAAIRETHRQNLILSERLAREILPTVIQELAKYGIAATINPETKWLHLVQGDKRCTISFQLGSSGPTPNWRVQSDRHTTLDFSQHKWIGPWHEDSPEECAQHVAKMIQNTPIDPTEVLKSSGGGTGEAPPLDLLKGETGDTE